jgi:hypothetical protein
VYQYDGPSLTRALPVSDLLPFDVNYVLGHSDSSPDQLAN